MSLLFFFPWFLTRLSCPLPLASSATSFHCYPGNLQAWKGPASSLHCAIISTFTSSLPGKVAWEDTEVDYPFGKKRGGQKGLFNSWSNCPLLCCRHGKCCYKPASSETKGKSLHKCKRSRRTQILSAVGNAALTVPVLQVPIQMTGLVMLLKWCGLNCWKSRDLLELMPK